MPLVLDDIICPWRVLRFCSCEPADLGGFNQVWYAQSSVRECFHISKTEGWSCDFEACHKRHVTLPMECQYAWLVCKVIVLDCLSRLSWIALMCTHTYKRNVTLHYIMMYIIYIYMYVYIYIYTSCIHHITWQLALHLYDYYIQFTLHPIAQHKYTLHTHKHTYT